MAEALGFVRPHRRDGSRGRRHSCCSGGCGGAHFVPHSTRTSSHPGALPPLCLLGLPVPPAQTPAKLRTPFLPAWSPAPRHLRPPFQPRPLGHLHLAPVSRLNTLGPPACLTPQHPDIHKDTLDPQVHGHTEGSPCHAQDSSAVLGLQPRTTPPSQTLPTCRSLVSLGLAAED